MTIVIIIAILAGIFGRQGLRYWLIAAAASALSVSAWILFNGNEGPYDGLVTRLLRDNSPYELTMIVPGIAFGWIVPFMFLRWGYIPKGNKEPVWYESRVRKALVASSAVVVLTTVAAIGTIAGGTDELPPRVAESSSRPRAEDQRPQRAQWATVSEAGVYSALMPPGTRRTETNIPAPQGPELVMKMVEAEEDGCYFAVTSMAADPTNIGRGASIESILEGSRDGVLRQTRATLLSEEPLSIEGGAGIRIRARTEEAGEIAHLESRIYVTGLRQIQGMIVCETVQSPDAASAFFTAFEVVPQPVALPHREMRTPRSARQ